MPLGRIEGTFWVDCLTRCVAILVKVGPVAQLDRATAF
jgi:hypothetical protein